MFDLDKNAEDKLTLLSVLIFSLAITSVIIYLNSTHSILGHSYRDVFFYLIEALRMSGTEISGYAYVNYLPPFIPFLTSLLFRLGFVSESSIFLTSGIFFFIGIMGMFKVLKLRFNNFYSFFGSFFYDTLLMNIKWVGNGTLDIAFVALMIWALYFFIQAMEKNQKYFYLAFPLGVLSFFTKYTGGLIFGLIILYFMSKPDIISNIKKYFKNIFGGLIAGAITSVPFFAYFFLNNIPLGFLNQFNEVSSESSLTTTHAGQLVGNDLFFYFKGMIYDISANDYFVGIIILAIIVIGIILMIYIFGGTFKNSYAKIKDKHAYIYKYPISSKLLYVSIIVSIIMILTSFLTASLFSFVYSEALLFVGLFIFAYSFNKVILIYDGVEGIKLSTYPYIALNITMLGLFLSFLVFFSAHLTKADRYFTSMAPGFIFIATLSVEMLLSKIKDVKFKKFNLKYLIPIFMMLLMLFASVHYLHGIGDDNMAICEKNAANWISDKEGAILSDRGPIYTWLLQKEIPYAQDAYNETLLNEELLENNATYYLSTEEVNLTDYSPVREFGNTIVYQKN